MGADPHGEILIINSMKKTSITYSIMLVVSLMFASCGTTSYKPYSFEQLRAADYTLPQNVNNIVISVTNDNFIDADITYGRDGNTSGQERKAYAKYIPAMMCTVLSDAINKSEYLKASVSSSPIIDTLSIQERDSIFKASHADAMIMVKKCVYRSQLMKDRWGKEIDHMTTSLSTELQFVLPNGATRNFQTLNDTITWWLAYEDDQFPSYKQLYYSISEQSGQHFAALLLPSWEKRQRSLLGSNSSKMRDAISWTERDDWEKARDIWADVVKSGGIQDQARAAINMGLYYEREDNELESAMWFSKALDILQNNSKCKKMKEETKMAQNLFNRAIDRQHEKVRLDKQMSTSR